MSTLSAFMAENAITVENEKYAASKRFIDKDGSPMKWEIRHITSSENDAIRKECMINVPIVGKRGRYAPELDTSKYLSRVAVRCTVFPDLKDAELQNSYGVMGEEELLKALLELPGELDSYYSEVQRVNGFDVGFDEKVETAKN